MSSTGQRFWKIITWFGWLPWVIILLALATLPSTINRKSLIDMTWSWSWSFLLILWWWGVFCSYSIGTVIKYLYYKPRPIPRNTSTLWRRINAGSMPSIHTSNWVICSIVGYISRTTHNKVQDSFSITLFLIFVWCALLIGVSRIKLKQHYPIDVLAGSLLGVIISMWLFFIYSPIIDITIKLLPSLLTS